MSEATPPPDQRPAKKSRTLVLVMLGIIVASIVAFLIIRPAPSGAVHTTPTSQH